MDTWFRQRCTMQADNRFSHHRGSCAATIRASLCLLLIISMTPGYTRESTSKTVSAIGQSTSQSLLDRAYRLIASGNADSAITILHERVLAKPSDLTARRYLVYALLKDNRWQEAQRESNTLIKLPTASATDWYMHGCADFGAGSMSEAERYFRHAVAKQGTLTCAWGALIITLTKQDKLMDAITLCRQLLSNAESARDKNASAYFRDLLPKLQDLKTKHDLLPTLIPPA